MYTSCIIYKRYKVCYYSLVRSHRINIQFAVYINASIPFLPLCLHWVQIPTSVLDKYNSESDYHVYG